MGDGDNVTHQTTTVVFKFIAPRTLLKARTAHHKSSVSGPKIVMRSPASARTRPCWLHYAPLPKVPRSPPLRTVSNLILIFGDTLLFLFISYRTLISVRRAPTLITHHDAFSFPQRSPNAPGNHALYAPAGCASPDNNALGKTDTLSKFHVFLSSKLNNQRAVSVLHSGCRSWLKRTSGIFNIKVQSLNVEDLNILTIGALAVMVT